MTKADPTLNRTTGISWTNHTWNPFVGCSVHTAGCTNCYAMEQAGRIEHKLGTSSSYIGTTKLAGNGKTVWTGVVNHGTKAARRKPLGIKVPSMIFVNSMSDFFHENAKDEWRDEALDVMAQADWHYFQILTKRPENIAPYLARSGRTGFGPNVWVGVTVEHAATAWRLDHIRFLVAGARFVSVEPLVGAVGPLDLGGIDWVIVGGESGRDARPMELAWAREVRDQCVAAGVPLFMKQLGGRTDKRGELEQIPEDLRFRELPDAYHTPKELI